jgi:hypothetical protein
LSKKIDTPTPDLFRFPETGEEMREKQALFRRQAAAQPATCGEVSIQGL